jgi:hypothetical protein
MHAAAQSVGLAVSSAYLKSMVRQVLVPQVDEHTEQCS